MENASKALIIAGAILLSISIIAIGMAVFRQAQEAMEGTGLSTEKISTYNAPFEKYEGTKSGSEIKTLCNQVVKNHNLAHTDDVSQQIQLEYNDNPTKEVNTTLRDATYSNSFLTDNKIASGKTYKVTLGYNAKSGLIVSIGISEVK